MGFEEFGAFEGDVSVVQSQRCQTRYRKNEKSYPPPPAQVDAWQ